MVARERRARGRSDQEDIWSREALSANGARNDHLMVDSSLPERLAFEALHITLCSYSKQLDLARVKLCARR